MINQNLSNIWKPYDIFLKFQHSIGLGESNYWTHESMDSGKSRAANNTQYHKTSKSKRKTRKKSKRINR